MEHTQEEMDYRKAYNEALKLLDVLRRENERLTEKCNKLIREHRDLTDYHNQLIHSHNIYSNTQVILVNMERQRYLELKKEYKKLKKEYKQLKVEVN